MALFWQGTIYQPTPPNAPITDPGAIFWPYRGTGEPESGFWRGNKAENYEASLSRQIAAQVAERRA